MPWRWMTLQAAGVALLVMVYKAGWLTLVMENDRSYLSYAILVLLAFGLLGQELGWRRPTKFVKAHVVTLGLVGTLVGITISMLAVGASVGVAASDEMIRTVVQGVLTSTGTTLFGLISWVWLDLSDAVCRSGSHE